MSALAPRFTRSASVLLRNSAFAPRAMQLRGGGKNLQGPGESLPIPSVGTGRSGMATDIAIWGFLGSAFAVCCASITYAQSKFGA